MQIDDLVLVGDNWKEMVSRYTRWKKALQDKEMKININTTKAFYARNFVRMQIRKYPCSVCDKRVGRNSVQRKKFQYWVHKRCSGICESLTRERFFLQKMHP